MCQGSGAGEIFSYSDLGITDESDGFGVRLTAFYDSCHDSVKPSQILKVSCEFYYILQ